MPIKIFVALFIMIMVISNDITAQPSVIGFDSLRITKPKKSQAVYTPDNPKIRQVKFKRLKLKRSPASVRQALGETGRTLLTLFTSIRSEHSREVTWMQTAEIITNDQELDWKVLLFCPGEFEKTKERIKNDDGSFSISADKHATLFWEKGGSGILVEKNDTIARFLLTLSPSSDSVLAHHFRSFSATDTSIKSIPFEYFTDARATDFGLKGIFRGKNLEVVFNSLDWKAWIYLENKFVAMYQSDDDPNRNKTNIDNRSIVPWLLYDKSLAASLPDLIRIAILSRLVNDLVNISTVSL
jgi:hypothetical protein